MSKELAGKLLERNRVGALLRVFATTPEAVKYQTESALAAVEKLLAIHIDDRPVFARIDLLVSSDQDYVDSDCGLSGERLRSEVQSRFPDAPVYVSEIKKGDIYCMLLNYGIACQLEDRIQYSIILSHSASSYATKENIEGLLSAMYQRARVAGVAIAELSELVMSGFPMNTFAIWHNKSLLTVGGFDLRAAKPLRKHSHTHEHVSGWSEQKAIRHGDGAVKYHVAGCEEIIPLARLVKNFGACIRVVIPQGEGMGWLESNPEVDTYAYHRHLAKLATKQKRQERMATTEGVSLEFIQAGLMDARIDVTTGMP